MELEQQSATRQTHRDQNPEDCSSSKNLRGHGEDKSFATHLTILTAQIAATLQQAVERSIGADLSGHYTIGAGLMS